MYSIFTPREWVVARYQVIAHEGIERVSRLAA